MNDQVIIAVANAITAQAETLKALIDALPRETRQAVAEKVNVVKDTPKPAAVEHPAPVVPVAAPAAPVVQAVPVAAPQPVAPPAAGCPITDHKGLLNYTMNRYRELGPIKGAEIQQVLTGLGYTNINDVKPEHYAAYHDGCEAIK